MAEMETNWGRKEILLLVDEVFVCTRDKCLKNGRNMCEKQLTGTKSERFLLVSYTYIQNVTLNKRSGLNV